MTNKKPCRLIVLVEENERPIPRLVEREGQYYIQLDPFKIAMDIAHKGVNPAKIQEVRGGPRLIEVPRGTSDFFRCSTYDPKRNLVTCPGGLLDPIGHGLREFVESREDNGIVSAYIPGASSWRKDHHEVSAQVYGVSIENSRRINLEPTDYEISSYSLWDFNLSTRLVGSLEIERIRTMGDLVNTPEAELKKIRGVGRDSLKDIKKFLGTHGLRLKKENKD